MIENAFPDFAGDSAFIEELASEVLAIVTDVSSAEQLRDPLEMALVGGDEQEVALTLKVMYDSLVAAGLVKEPKQKASAVSSAPAAPYGQPVLSTKRLESIFSKELKKHERASGPH